MRGRPAPVTLARNPVLEVVPCGQGRSRGRNEPMAGALAALREARQHGTRAAVLICDPAGAGKTALLEEICRQAARMSIRVGWSKCDSIEQVWPGAPVIAALRAGRD